MFASQLEQCVNGDTGIDAKEMHMESMHCIWVKIFDANPPYEGPYEFNYTRVKAKAMPLGMHA